MAPLYNGEDDDVATTERLPVEETGPFACLCNNLVKSFCAATTVRNKRVIVSLGLLLLLPAVLSVLFLSWKVDGVIAWPWGTVFLFVWLVDAMCLAYYPRIIPRWSASLELSSRTNAVHFVSFACMVLCHVFIALRLDGLVDWKWTWVLLPFILTGMLKRSNHVAVFAWLQVVFLAPRLDATLLWPWPIVFLPLELYAIGCLAYCMYTLSTAPPRQERAKAGATLLGLVLLLGIPLVLLLLRLEGTCEFSAMSILTSWLVGYGILAIAGLANIHWSAPQDDFV
ncbi:hypothetical protein SDRG_04700 [Saprolegnia diclina VS20]|uniref:Uncharacterized protein n=1 Tax=Saprolegnia diclina (strain VS20) TaxID=1156394 RepID=T0QU83_SAPDV|nr:hypothetical protein SDRG_04700 [Saprolegnia diclina VS20]EQC38276.1 hypothetical protein SDRG_04700 [Saprolegnia diclina VS20]|eukprot:XP_008608603.1 hypothetical protein SDRG_04700 [Saprolegnia diclina VS20]